MFAKRKMDKKYGFTKETTTVDNHVLHRIVALKDFVAVYGYEVHKGDLGGWIEKEENLSQEGGCWVCDNARVCGYARVHANARVSDNALVSGDARVCDNAWVRANAQVCDAAQVSGYAVVSDNARVSGDALVSDNTWVHGNARVRDNAQVSGYAWVCDNARVCDSGCITSSKDYFCVGPIGSRNDTTTFYRGRDCKIYVSCGCFNGDIDIFEKQVEETHKDNEKHKNDYLKAIELALSRLEIAS